jgi:hypothetical protein
MALNTGDSASKHGPSASLIALREAHTRVYRSWFDVRQPLETFFAALYYAAYALPIVACVTAIAAGGGALGWGRVAAVLAAGWLAEGLLFVVSHTYSHMNMLNWYQAGRVGVSWAYFHHYVDPRLYGLLPFQYRLSLAGGVGLFSAIAWRADVPVLFCAPVFTLGVLDCE